MNESAMDCNTNIRTIRDFRRAYANDTCDVGIRQLSDIFAKPSCDGGISDIFDITGDWGHYPLSGKHICELDNAKSAYSNDLFAVSRTSATYKKPFKDLSSQLIYEILTELSVHTMAYEEKYNWAVSSHNHDKMYSKFEFDPNPTYFTDSTAHELGTIRIRTDELTCGEYQSIHHNPECNAPIEDTYVVKTKKILLTLPPKPMIGTLKVIAQPTINSLISHSWITTDSSGTQVNPYRADGQIRDDYNGWVFPNGGVIANTNNQLSDAAAFYAEGSNIRLPDLNGFFACTNGTAAISQATGQAGLKPHRHHSQTANFKCDVELDMENTRLWSTSGNSGQVYVHHGDHNKAGATKKWTTEKEYTSDMNDISFNTFYTTEASQTTAEPQPVHNIMLVMMYIGGETREYYEKVYHQLHG